MLLSSGLPLFIYLFILAKNWNSWKLLMAARVFSLLHYYYLFFRNTMYQWLIIHKKLKSYRVIVWVQTENRINILFLIYYSGNTLLITSVIVLQLKIHYEKRRGCSGRALTVLRARCFFVPWMTLVNLEISISMSHPLGFPDVTREKGKMGTLILFFTELEQIRGS